MEDLKIIELFFERNEKAIEETEKKYGRICFKIAHNILGRYEDAEECVNDTYLTVWDKIPPARPNNFTAFICKITRNLSLKKLDYNNALKRAPEALVSLSELEETLPDKSFAPDVSDEKLGALISKFLLKEKTSARNVFIRRYWFLDSISDIAELYSFSESKVKNMLYHTRNKLKIFLQKEGIEI